MIFYENTYDVVALGLTHPGYLFVYTKYWKHGGFLIFMTDKLYYVCFLCTNREQQMVTTDLVLLNHFNTSILSNLFNEKGKYPTLN